MLNLNTLSLHDRPCFYLNRLEIPRVDQCKYLRIMICTKNCDIDLKRQMRKFYADINVLSRMFAKCSPDVNMYCSTMWYHGTVTAIRKLRIAYITAFVGYCMAYQNITVQVRCSCNLILSHSVNY